MALASGGNRAGQRHATLRIKQVCGAGIYGNAHTVAHTRVCARCQARDQLRALVTGDITSVSAPSASTSSTLP